MSETQLSNALIDQTTPRLAVIGAKLQELAVAQDKLREALKTESSRMQQTETSNLTSTTTIPNSPQQQLQQIDSLASKASTYTAKAISLKRDMIALRERVEKLKKRTTVLQHKKQRFDAEYIENERRLVAVDVTKTSPDI